MKILYLIIPIMLGRSQKKSFEKQNIAEMDYIFIEIDNNSCVESLYKDEQVLSTNTHALRQLTSYFEDANRLILVFNKVEYVCLRKENITGDVDKLKAHLEKIMSKTAKGKK